MKKILIIEDDSSLIRGLKDSFVQAKFSVLTAMDGESGLSLALSEYIDIIILDIMLPKMNGFEICRTIRESQRDTPIIMLTAKGQEADIVRGLNLGADDYVTKPFSIAELIARVNAFLRKKKNDDIFSFDGFEVNFTSKKLLFKDEEIALTPKEFGVITLFIRREGYALSRETILNSVWRDNILTTQRSVDRCVNTLRKKLKKYFPEKKYIQSIRDIGYRFETDKPHRF